MTNRLSESNSNSREQKLKELLDEAHKRPGIPEIMRVYGGWRRADQGLDSYRAATRQPHHIMTTDHSNPS